MPIPPLTGFQKIIRELGEEFPILYPISLIFLFAIIIFMILTLWNERRYDREEEENNEFP
jgi:hypothetical protein